VRLGLKSEYSSPMMVVPSSPLPSSLTHGLCEVDRYFLRLHDFITTAMPIALQAPSLASLHEHLSLDHKQILPPPPHTTSQAPAMISLHSDRIGRDFDVKSRPVTSGCWFRFTSVSVGVASVRSRCPCPPGEGGKLGIIAFIAYKLL
jgi:hypothetical protein